MLLDDQLTITFYYSKIGIVIYIYFDELTTHTHTQIVRPNCYLANDRRSFVFMGTCNNVSAFAKYE